MNHEPQHIVSTDLEVEHVLSYVKRAVVGNNLWSATIKEGMFLEVGKRFDLRESVDNGATRTTAQPLLVVASGASSAYEINQGLYSIHEILGKLNAWTAAALSDADIAGTYEFDLTHDPNDGSTRTRISFHIPGAGPNVLFWFWLPKDVNHFLGILDQDEDDGFGLGIPRIRVFGLGDDDTNEELLSHEVPLRNSFSYAVGLLVLENERGEFFDQASTLPPEVAAYLTETGDKGLVILDGVHTAGVTKDGDTFVEYVRLQNFGQPDILTEWSYDDTRGPITVQQYYYAMDTLANHLKKLFYSTPDAPTHPHVTYGTPTSLERFASSIPAAAWPELIRALSPAQSNTFRMHHAVRQCTSRPPLPPLVVNDGGRAAAGSTAPDCAVRALAIALELPYSEVSDELGQHASEAHGIPLHVVDRVLARRGWNKNTCIKAGASALAHPHLADLPQTGRVVAATLHHLFVMVDGVLHDMEVPPDVVQCVFEWWTAPR